MSKFTYDQVSRLASQIATLAAAFNPSASAALLALIQISTQLNAILSEIKKNDPDLWAKVVADFSDAVKGWEDSILLQPAPEPPSS